MFGRQSPNPLPGFDRKFLLIAIVIWGLVFAGCVSRARMAHGISLGSFQDCQIEGNTFETTISSRGFGGPSPWKTELELQIHQINPTKSRINLPGICRRSSQPFCVSVDWSDGTTSENCKLSWDWQGRQTDANEVLNWDETGSRIESFSTGTYPLSQRIGVTYHAKGLVQQIIGVIFVASLLTFLAFPIRSLMLVRIRMKRRSSQKCIHCGYSLKEIGEMSCPECGWNRPGQDLQDPPGML